jgi:LCP family protein required for cell wall assembly
VDDRPLLPPAHHGRGGRGPVPPSRPPAHDGLLRGRDVRQLRRAMNLRPSGPPQRSYQPVLDRRRRAVRIGKIAVAVLSTLVLLFTGYAWATFQSLTGNLTTTSVIGSNAADGATDILLVGNDSRVDAQGNPLSKEVLAELRAGANEGELTDTLILVRIPNDGRRAVGISIPRDTFVEIPGGYGRHKINSAYGRAKNARAAELRGEGGMDSATIEREAVLEGRRTLVKTIEGLTGAGVDHYAEVNLLGFYEITNAIGGVEVCLNRATRDPDSGANFKAGRQTISGADALAFVRQRKNLPRGDLDRIVRQQVFMSAVANKVLSAGTLANPSTLRSLINSIQRSVVLDDKLDPLVFAEQMRGIASGAIQFVTIPVVAVAAQTADGDAVTVDVNAVRTFVREQASSGTEERPTANTANANITVDVRNASGASGLASRVLDELANRGFARGDAANAAARRSSVVRYASGEQAAGNLVAEALGGLPTEQDSTLAAGRVRVFLGQDYAGPGVQRMAGRALVQLDGARAAVPAAQPSGDPPITAGDIRCVD